MHLGHGFCSKAPNEVFIYSPGWQSVLCSLCKALWLRQFRGKGEDKHGRACYSTSRPTARTSRRNSGEKQASSPLLQASGWNLRCDRVLNDGGVWRSQESWPQRKRASTTLCQVSPEAPAQAALSWVCRGSQIMERTCVNMDFFSLAKAKCVFGAINLPAAWVSPFLAGRTLLSPISHSSEFYFMLESTWLPKAEGVSPGHWGLRPWPRRVLVMKTWTTSWNPTWSSGSWPIRKEQWSCTAHPAGLLRGSNQTIYINEGRCNYRQCVGMTHSILSAQKPWLGRTERYRHICSFRAAPGMVLGEFPAWRKPFFSKELTWILDHLKGPT